MKNPAPLTEGLWTPSEWYLAQVVHVLAGAFVMVAAHVHGWDAGITWLAFLGVTAIKEFLVDVSPFESDTYFGSLQDFTCYQIGAIAGRAIPEYFWAGVAVASLAILVLFAVDLAMHADWTSNPFS